MQIGERTEERYKVSDNLAEYKLPGIASNLLVDYRYRMRKRSESECLAAGTCHTCRAICRHHTPDTHSVDTTCTRRHISTSRLPSEATTLLSGQSHRWQRLRHRQHTSARPLLQQNRQSAQNGARLRYQVLVIERH